MKSQLRHFDFLKVCSVCCIFLQTGFMVIFVLKDIGSVIDDSRQCEG